MKMLELSTASLVERHNVGTIEIDLLENKWEDNMREVAACIDGMELFAGGICFRSQMECV